MKRLSLIALAMTLLCASAFGLGGRERPAAEAAGPMTIRMGVLKGPTGIGAIKLFETPPALPSGATLSLEAIAAADVMAARLISGELEAAVLPVNMAAKLYNAGMPYRLVAIVGNGMVKVLTTDPAVKGLADLRGRDVYVAGQGATPEYLMRTVLKAGGMDPDTDLRMVFSMPYPEIAASMVAGKIDVAVLPEPFATMVLKGNPAARVPFSLTSLWTAATGLGDYPMSAFVVRASLLDERPSAVSALMAAYSASISSVLADPVAAGALVEKHDMGLKAAVAAAAIPVSNYAFERAGAAREAVEGILSVFLAAAPASIGGKLPDAAFYAAVKP